MLIVFSGLPGTGKTTISRILATRLRATYLRIDIIEQSLRNANLPGNGPEGYDIAIALAASNLTLGNSVVADCVNPVPTSRQAWQKIATQSSVPLLNIEVICSDQQEHRRRVESRTSDIPNLISPNWQSVQTHHYKPWNTDRLTIDSSIVPPSECISLIKQKLRNNPPQEDRHGPA